MRGILSYGGYVPYRRLALAEIGETFSGGARGTRSVASFDQDTTTLGVEAGRLALRGLDDGVVPATLWFSTTEPAYADKTNATTCLLYTSPSPRDATLSRMPSSA